MPETPSAAVRVRAARVRAALSPRNISAVYLFAIMFVVFALVVPDTFLRAGVWRSLLDAQSLYAIAAIAVVIPLAAGAFNLAIGAEVGLAAILVAALVGKLGMPLLPAIVLTVLGGAFIGAMTGILVVKAHIDSLIATLGTSSILMALTAWVSGGQQILGLSPSFQQLATTRVLGLTTSTWIMLGIALVVWYVLEGTPVGRHVYATGGNPQAARLAGVRTSTVIVGSLMACGVLAACAGVLQTARIAAGDPTVGAGYLLPAYAAAMLGSTQLRGGRFNVWGAVLAVYVLATGINGLQLAGAPVWIPDLFNGLALLIAVGVAARQKTLRRSRRRDTAVSAPENSPRMPMASKALD